jgi:hypothetical protein
MKITHMLRPCEPFFLLDHRIPDYFRRKPTVERPGVVGPAFLQDVPAELLPPEPDGVQE